MREGQKKTIDGLVRSIDDGAFLFQLYMIQFTGCSCVLSKMSLGANGLYIATYVYSFDLPSRICDLPKMEATITHLLTMTVIVDKVMPAKSDDISTPRSLNREEKIRTNEKLAWIRDTFHTPPPETMPELPVLLFVRPDTASHDRIIIDYPKKKKGVESLKSVTTSDGKYYNIYLKKIRDKHLLDNEQ